MEINEDYQQLQKNWRTKILKSFYSVIAILFVAEIVIYVLMIQWGFEIQSEVAEYICVYILLPSGVNLLSVAAANYVVKKNISDWAKNLTIILCLMAICFAVSSVHSYFLVIPCIFVLPILTSVMFDDEKLARYTTILSIVCIVLCTFSACLFDQVWSFKTRVVSNLACIGFVIVSFVLCKMLLQFGKDKNNLISQNVQKNKEMMRALKVDAMTGLYNHTEFYSRLEQYYREYDATERKLTVAVLDVDHFKVINDTYGHERGDAVLIQIAEVLRRSCASSGHVFRYGGEEFAVICRHFDEARMQEHMNMIIKEVNGLKFASMPGERIGISCGIYSYNGDSTKPQEIFTRADHAMYQAKEQGRNRCVCYHE